MKNVTLVAMFVATAMFVPVVPAAATDPPTTDALISGAKTAADHDALASRYDQQAAAARAQAAQHRSMGQTYKSFPGGKGGLGASAMPYHCERLAKSFEEQARMYDTMAATERELAKSAK